MPSAKKTSASKGQVRQGSIHAINLPGVGYCHGVVARAPRDGAEVGFALLYIRPVAESSAKPPAVMQTPGRWGHVCITLVSADALRSGRWKRCGEVHAFDPDDWPVPPRRASEVDESEPIETWGKDRRTGKPHPCGEMWSIEVTADEPTMTLLDNAPASREEALGFPKIEVVTAASRFEKSLTRYLREMGSTFWDHAVRPDKIDAAAIRRWNAYATKVRKQHADFAPTWLPAGRKTDRALAGGEWLAFPLSGGGFGAAMLVEKPPKHLRFMADVVVMTMRRRWDHWPTLEQVLPLTANDGAYVSQTSMICVRDGRWRVLGRAPDFNPEDWPWPKPTFRDWQDPKDVIIVHNAKGKKVKVQIDPKIKELDPHAGQRCNGMSDYRHLEFVVPTIMNRTHWSFHKKPDVLPSDGVVTPPRLAAWRAINAAIRAAAAKK